MRNPTLLFLFFSFLIFSKCTPKNEYKKVEVNKTSVFVDSTNYKIKTTNKLFLDFWSGMSREEFEYVKTKLIQKFVLSINKKRQVVFKISSPAIVDLEFIVVPKFDSFGLASITLFDPSNPSIYDDHPDTNHENRFYYYDDIILLYTQKYGKPKTRERMNPYFIILRGDYYPDSFFQYTNIKSKIFIEISIEHGLDYDENSDDLESIIKQVKGLKITYMSIKENQFRDGIEKAIQEDSKNRINNAVKKTKDRI
jgi:hypothetical protein